MSTDKFFSKHNLIKLAFESGLIVFSVLLALFLNEYRTVLKEAELKRTALANVRQEIANNMGILDEWIPYHESVVQNLQEALDDEAIRAGMISNRRINFGMVMPGGIVQQLIQRTSWEALRNVNIISNLDYGDVLALSKIYDLQEEGVQQTIRIILAELSSREAQQIDKIEETLLILRNSFAELVSQETFLKQHYKMVLEQLDMQR